MTSFMAPSIMATCQQTRFHTSSTTSSEIDIHALDLSIVPQAAEDATPHNRKTKARIELLSGAHLRLKTDTIYGLLGRNGTGKSTLLRALAEKAIPGLPERIRVAILQQTSIDGDGKHSTNDNLALGDGKTKNTVDVLNYVLGSDKAKVAVAREVEILTKDAENDESPKLQLHRYRLLQHERLKEQLFEAQKNASLRSGARGLQARKELKALEGQIELSTVQLDQQEDIWSEVVQADLGAAAKLLLELQTRLETMSVVDMELTARHILHGLGFTETTINSPIDTLSGGWRMRCHLAGVLLQKSDIMILDEPTNHLDLLGVLWLQNYLIKMKGKCEKTVILVSHDRDFVDHVCDEVIVLRDQSLTYFAGNLSSYEADLRARIGYLTHMQESQGKETARIEKTIAAAVKTGKRTGDDNKLRMAKSRQKKMETGAGLMVGLNGSRFKLSRDRAGFQNTKLAVIEIPTIEHGVSITLPIPPELRFPGALISLERIEHKYQNGNDFILTGLDLSIHMGDRIGIAGLNGSGKSTLIKIFANSIEPSKGIMMRHPHLRLGYYSQHAVEELWMLGRDNPSMTALMKLTAASTDLSEQEMRSLLGMLGLQGRLASDVPIANLSGGQLVRLALALILWSHPNLLILDEVTTHLDYHTVTALSNALCDFDGAVLLVSHDRWMIRRVVQGEMPEVAEDDANGARPSAPGEEAQRRRCVYTLRAGKLKLQDEGIRAYEASLEKRLAKLAAR